MPRVYEEKQLYQATVTSQDLVEDRDGNPLFILSARIEGQLADRFKPEGGILPCPSIEVDITFPLAGVDDTRLDIAASNLQKLGFDGDDISRLSSDHTSPITFVGKKVFVTPKYSVKNDEERTYWNLRFPVGNTNKKVLASKDLKGSPAAQAFRDALERRKAAQTAGASGDVPF